MRTPRKPSLLEWLVCLGAIAAGAAILGVSLSGGLSCSTPEDELASAEGVPTNVREFRTVRAHFVSFTVGGYSMEYDGAAPKFQEVLTAVQSNRPIQVWVSKKNEALIPIGSQVTLYKLCREQADSLLRGGRPVRQGSHRRSRHRLRPDGPRRLGDVCLSQYAAPLRRLGKRRISERTARAGSWRRGEPLMTPRWPVIYPRPR